MDVKIRAACQKAINLCNYMLQTQDDDFVRGEKVLITSLIVNDQNEQAAYRAREVSRYIKHNFDNVLGENISLDIDELIDKSSIHPIGLY